MRTSTPARPSPEKLLVAPTTAEIFNTIAPPLIPVACWRLDDVRFEFDSSFVRAEMRESRDGETHGYFNVKITPAGSAVGGSSDVRPYPDGAWLRPRKP